MKQEPGSRRRRHPPVPLPLGWRIFFTASGAILVLIGLAGLVLPGIQGILTIALGVVLLSLASEWFYWLLRRAFHRWPRGWRRIEKLRRSVVRRLAARVRRREGRAAETRTEGRAQEPPQRSSRGTHERSVGPS